MAMVTCPECLSAVDDSEVTCPYCGHLLPTVTEDQTPEPEGVQIYAEERTWTAGNTLIVILLTLLIIAIGAFLYLNVLKWPYDDAKRYYEEERVAYQEQVIYYQEQAQKIQEQNDLLDEKLDDLRTLLYSGEEPYDASAANTAREILQRASVMKTAVPEITAEVLPVPARDSLFHARDINDTAKAIDQMRYSLYQQYSELQLPDYTELIATIEKARDNLQESINRQKESANVSHQVRTLMDNYSLFMDEYITFLAENERGSEEYMARAVELQTTYAGYLREIHAIDTRTLSAEDLSFMNGVLADVERKLTESNLTDAVTGSGQ